jgi:hypothetical protein
MNECLHSPNLYFELLFMHISQFSMFSLSTLLRSTDNCISCGQKKNLVKEETAERLTPIPKNYKTSAFS